MPSSAPFSAFARSNLVEVWLVDLEAAREALLALEAAVPRLSTADTRKIARGANAETRRERESAHIALRLLIERAFGSSWRRVPYGEVGTGKPVLEGLPGSFNLAHAGGQALIGLSAAGDIGVDLEPRRTIEISDERRARIEAAAVALARGAPLPEEPKARFLQAWVRLEACAKADGSGIGRLLTGVGIVGEQGVSEQRAAEIGARFNVADVDAGPDVRAAVALPSGISVPVPLRLPAEPMALARLAAQGHGPWGDS